MKNELDNFKISVSEQVSPGHPDKICDQIADSILDNCLKQDKNSRTAIEVLISNNNIFITGEINSKAEINYQKIIKNVLKKTSYSKSLSGVDQNNFNLFLNLQEQSKDIRKSIFKNDEIGSGDQSTVIGYATSENDAYLPWSFFLANELIKKAYEIYNNKKIKELLPDMKIQVAGIYKENKFQLISISFYMQHKKEFKQENFYQNVKKQIVNPIIDKYKLNKDFDFFLNKNSYFNIGGSKADTGLTGRKIIADTYGCDIMHGGGSFSGKDASKIDRTGAYLARFIAKNIVTNKLADKCLIKLSYLFGNSKPNHIFLDTFSTNKISEEKIMNLIKKNFIFKLTKIINDFDLNKANFKKLSTFGSFGRNEFDLKWEKTKNLVC